MTQNNPSKNNTDKPKGRLDNPVLRLASIFVAIIAICTLLYSLASSLPIIPIMAGIFFLMLWFIPQIWKWIEWVFSKRPSSAWGRFTLNLVLAIIMASAFEDVLEIIMKFGRIAFWMLRRIL
ncbi:MAG: hypothetical protein JW963_13325 [Anaerolineales bacterium]|nr:hypothetical protein [Anaerolineales bacterium]